MTDIKGRKVPVCLFCLLNKDHHHPCLELQNQSALRAYDPTVTISNYITDGV